MTHKIVRTANSEIFSNREWFSLLNSMKRVCLLFRRQSFEILPSGELCVGETTTESGDSGTVDARLKYARG